MKKQMENEQREKIIKITLDLIDKNGGALNVNLRQVAREANCSAPNIYNYFKSLDDLLNVALERICTDFMVMMAQQKDKAETKEQMLQSAFTTFISYGVKNPARMNFFYFEKLNVELAQNTKSVANGVGGTMAQLLLECSATPLDKNTAQEISNILHWYIIGQLSEHMTGREIIKHMDEYINNLFQKSIKLFYILSENL